MQRTLFLTIPILLAGLAGGVVLPAVAKEDKPPRREDFSRERGHLLPPRLVEELHLTAEQRATYDRLQAQWHEARERHRDQHHDRMQQLRRELRVARDEGNEARVRQIRQQISELMRPQLELRQRLIHEFRATLTPEQQTVLDTARERARQRFEDRVERRREKPS